MYQFSRSIYRELAPQIHQAGCGLEMQQRILDSCETTMQRLLNDRRYFARPTKTLFCELRGYFSMRDQLIVYRSIDRHVRLAIEYLESASAEELITDATRECRAHTRKGTPCQREPLPGRDYCPSHKHLEENLDLDVLVAEVPADDRVPTLV